MYEITKEIIKNRRKEMIEYGYTENTVIRYYQPVWYKALRALNMNNTDIQNAINRFVDEYTKNKPNATQAVVYKAVSILIFGNIESELHTVKYTQFHKRFNSSNEYFQKIHNEFRHFYVHELLNKESTFNQFNTIMLDFYDYLETMNIDSVFDVDFMVITVWINNLNKTTTMTAKNIKVIRRFLTFLYEKGYHIQNISTFLTVRSKSSDAKFKSYWSREEIALLLHVTKKRSQRDYAIILIIARLGLRISDVINLKFENIDWKNNKLCFHQFKTHKYVEYPLLNEIGTAILGYIKKERPITECQHIFVRTRGKKSALAAPVGATIISKFLKETGLDFSDRKKGAHSLRHTLAKNLLDEGTPLDILSLILGHTNIQSTISYTTINTNKLGKLGRYIEYDL